MSRLVEKIAAFAQQARKNPVQVNVHNAGNKPGVDKIVTYICLLAGAAGLTAASMGQPDQDKAVQRMQQNSTPSIIQRADRAPLQAQALAAPETMASVEVEEEPGPRLNYVHVNYMGRQVLALDEASRLMLVKDAAAKHELHTVGLNWKDLYGIIHAETAWIARDGMGKNGVVSEGLAQLEPNTAKALGVSDPNDPVEAINASAALMKEGAQWGRSKIAGMGMGSSEMRYKLREAVSIYYNLSTRGRNAWTGRNTYDLPEETIRHINNSIDGAALAAHIDKRVAREMGEQKQVGMQQAVYKDGVSL
jgi:hypothetical protein